MIDWRYAHRPNETYGRDRGLLHGRDRAGEVERRGGAEGRRGAAWIQTERVSDSESVVSCHADDDG